MKDRNLSWQRAALGLALVVLAGCGKTGSHGSNPSQVAATVNDVEISVHQIQAALQREPQLSASLGEAAGRRVLQSLVEQELAAQAARRDGLDSDPAVLQAMELAKREVLARAYQDRLAAKVETPNTGDIDRYYDEHPLLFAQRQQYTLQEVVIEASVDALAALSQRITHATGAEDVIQAVQSSGLRFGTRQAIRYAEELPPASLERISAMQAGQSVMVPRDGGATVITLMRADRAAVERQAARTAIAAIIQGERQREQVARSMSSLRDGARVQYFGRFAPDAASQASAPTPAASESADSGASAPTAAPSAP